MIFDEVLDLLAARSSEEPREVGDNWMVHCPAHHDRTPSLALRDGGNGKTLICCYAGCAASDVVAAVGLTMGDLAGGADGHRSEGIDFSRGWTRAPTLRRQLTSRVRAGRS